MAPVQKLPNILITGTPGTGKSTLARLLAESQPQRLRHLNVSELVKEHGLHDGYDAEFDTYVLDDDRVCDFLEPLMARGGAVVDFHSCDLFPERWFDLVLVLRSETAVLYERLERRGYAPRKLTENMECEIMQVVLEEARGAYELQRIVELPSNTPKDMQSNLERTLSWLSQHCGHE